MTQKFSLVDRLGASVRASYEADRRDNPHRFAGSSDGLGNEFLFVENVARMLGCGVKVTTEDMRASVLDLEAERRARLGAAKAAETV